MIYQLTDIVRDVRIAIDQNMKSEQLIDTGDIETLSLDEIIKSKIVESVRRVGNEAPSYLLEEGHVFGEDALFWEKSEKDEDWKDGVGFVLLPEDFMRLIAFKMSDWERTLYSAISPDDPLYQKQSSRFKGIRGNVQKPVAAIINRHEGKALEFFSCNSEEAYIERGSYLPYPKIDPYNGIDISQRCYEAVVYTTAGLVLLTYGDVDKAQTMTEQAKILLQ